MAYEIKIYRPTPHSPNLSSLSLESLKINNLSAMKNCRVYSEHTIPSKNPSDIKNEIALIPGDIIELEDSAANTAEYFYVDSEGNLLDLIMNHDHSGIIDGEEIILEEEKKKSAPFDIGKAKPYVGKLKEAACPICGKKIVCLGVDEKKMGKEKLFVSTFFCDKCEATIEVGTKAE